MGKFKDVYEAVKDVEDQGDRHRYLASLLVICLTANAEQFLQKANELHQSLGSSDTSGALRGVGVES